MAEGGVILEKGPAKNLEVAHQACEGSWRLWYHAICKDMWCATHTSHHKTFPSSGIHVCSPSATENVAEGRVILEKGSVKNLEVEHQACEGSWRLWYHGISKDMWCAHVLHTTRHFCRLAYVAPLRPHWMPVFIRCLYSCPCTLITV